MRRSTQVRLGPRNFLRLWSAILCERRVLLVAEDVRTLSACVHAASAILYPFAWQHVYIPLLPTPMLEYVSAPMPFIIGVRFYLFGWVRVAVLDVFDV